MTDYDGAGGGNVRFLRVPEVLSRVGMGRSAWYQRVLDGRAPPAVKIGAKLAVWPENVIAEYQASIVEHGERVGQYSGGEGR